MLWIPAFAGMTLNIMSDEVIVKFNKVSFEWASNKPILVEADFALRRGSKITLMGQNGAGKSTIFKLITGGANCVSCSKRTVGLT